jgi:hypothetical protein
LSWGPCFASAAALKRRPPQVADEYARRRAEMVNTRSLWPRDITDKRVLEAMGKVPRERFVMTGDEMGAYEDSALPIAQGQNHSQPYIVALMTQLAAVKPGGPRAGHRHRLGIIRRRSLPKWARTFAPSRSYPSWRKRRVNGWLT